MKSEAPYLIAGAEERRDRSVAVIADVTAGVVEVTVHGRWDRALWHDAGVALGKCFAEQPAAVIVDLHDMGDPQAASAAAWWMVGMRGADLRPTVQLALCLPAATALSARLHRLNARRYLPVYASMPEARAAITARLPMTDRVQLRLAPKSDAAGRASNLVADACQTWRLPHMLHNGRMVMSELVDNAVEHAATELLITVSRRGTGIHLAVSDGDTRLPRLIKPCRVRSTGAARRRGRGLQVVHTASTAWGAMPTTAGKVVWAVLHPDGVPQAAR